MRRVEVLAGVAALAVGATLSASAMAQEAPLAQDTPLAKTMKALGDAARKDDCPAALPLARQVIANPGFGDHSEAFHIGVYQLAAYCAEMSNELDEALEDARRATGYPGAPQGAWDLRLVVAERLDRTDDMVEVVRTLAAANHDMLNAVPLRIFANLLRKSHEPTAWAKAAPVLAALEAADYAPGSPTEPADELWLTDAQMEADAGNHDRADKLLSRVTDVSALIDAAVDARFADVIAADPAHFDLRTAQERELAADQAIVTAHPELLEAIVNVFRDLRALERYDEAMALADQTLDRIAAAPKTLPLFKDEDDRLNWLKDAKASLLFELGRVAEAEDLERDAARLGEFGGQNVSQAINLAGFLNNTGRPQEALDDLKVFDGTDAPHANAYGLAWLHAERACADQQLSRDADGAVEMAYLSAHVEDNPAAELRALLCRDDLDGAAAEFKMLLQDPGQRVLALTYLSQWDLPPHFTSLGADLHARLAAVAARPDVIAAAAKAGRTLRIHLDAVSYLDDF